MQKNVYYCKKTRGYICKSRINHLSSNSLPPIFANTRSLQETRSLLNSLFHKRETTILCISDLHNGLPVEGISIIRQAVHSYDAIITLGDIPLDALSIIGQISNEASIPITGVMGNHDSNDVLQRAGIQELSCTDVTEIAGMRLVGLSGTIRYKRGDYVMLEQEEAENIIAGMPPAPILASHDCCEKSPLCYGMAHSGMPGLCCYMEKERTAIHIHGHVHKNKWYNVGKTACLSVFGIVKVHLRGNKIVGADMLWRPWNEG